MDPRTTTPSPIRNSVRAPVWVTCVVCLGIVLAVLQWRLRTSSIPRDAEPTPLPPSTGQFTPSPSAAVPAAQGREHVPPKSIPPPAPPAVMQERFGIAVEGIYLRDGGSSLEFRYRVKDVTRSGNLLRQRTRVGTLIDESDGSQYLIANPSLGGAFVMEGDAAVAGAIMALPLPNPRNQIRAGSRITIAMGAFVLEHLEVQ